MEGLQGAVCRRILPDGTRILMGANLVDELRAKVMEAYVALPRRGLEIGGVLYGHAHHHLVAIEGFEETPCEHLYGPSFRLSETDSQRLGEIVARGEPVIGFFRSFTSRAPEIDEADASYIRECFQGLFVMFLIEPLSVEHCLARIQLFRDGEPVAEEDELFIFDAQSMMSEEPEPAPWSAASPSAVVPADPTPVLEPEPPEPAPEPEPDPEPSRPVLPPPRRNVQTAETAEFLPADPMPVAEPEPDPDPPRPPLPPSHRSVQTAQVHASVAGTGRPAPAPAFVPPEPAPEPPRSVLPPSRHNVETAPRWAETAEPQPQPARNWWLPLSIVLLSAVIGAGAYEIWDLSRQPRWAELQLDVKPSGSDVVVTWDANAAKAVNASRALLDLDDGGAHRQAALSPAEIRAGKYTFTPQHRDVGARLVLYAKSLGVSGDQARLVFAPAPQPSATPVQPPAGSAPEPAQERSRTASTDESTSSQEVHVAIPESIRARLSENITVPVRVTINPQGRVTSATALMRGADGLHRYLENAAVKAAREWRFSRRSGTRNQVRTLQFVFQP